MAIAGFNVRLCVGAAEYRPNANRFPAAETNSTWSARRSCAVRALAIGPDSAQYLMNMTFLNMPGTDFAEDACSRSAGNAQ